MKFYNDYRNTVENQQINLCDRVYIHEITLLPAQSKSVHRSLDQFVSTGDIVAQISIAKVLYGWPLKTLNTDSTKMLTVWLDWDTWLELSVGRSIQELLGEKLLLYTDADNHLVLSDYDEKTYLLSTIK